MYAGLDASGTPDLRGIGRGHDPYVVVLAVVNDREALEAAMGALRVSQGMAIGAEFHAHQMVEERQIAVLEAAADLELCVGALIIDKAQTRQVRESMDLPSPRDFESMARLALLEPFFARYKLKLVQCDEDIQGKARQNQFRTEVKKLHRANWPGASLKLQYKRSSRSDLTQLADVIAYGLAHLARGTVRLDDLKQILEALRNDTRNLIIGPKPWDG